MGKKTKKELKQEKLNIKNDLFDNAKFSQIFEESEMLKQTNNKGKKELEIFPELLEDLYYSLYKNSPQLKNPEEVNSIYHLNRNLIENARQTKEYNELRAYTKLDAVQSATASATIGENLLSENKEEINKIREYLKNLKLNAKQLQEILKSEKEIQKQLKQKNLNPSQIQQLQSQLQVIQQNKQKKQSTIQVIQNNMNQCNNNIINNGLQNALSSSVDAIKEQNDLFGWGTETGNLQLVDFKERLKLSQQILKNPKLIKLAKLAGKFRRLAIKKQKVKTKFALEEVSDVIQSNNITQIIPSELIYLADQNLNFLFYLKYLKEELLTYELSGKETKGKGSMIVCIDCSSSMSGDKEIWCKAVALALIQIANKENRNAIVIPFDTEVHKTFEFYKNEFKISTMLEMASFFTGGGTFFDPPLKKSMEYLQNESKLKKADIIFITDGESEVTEKTKAEFEELKQKLKFSMITIVIGEEFGVIQHSLKPISNFLYPVAELTDELASNIFESV